ncbi:MAG: efflux RND transporter periplasmic adaptor subunit [Bacteroidia bacterium]|nr:efflux RND transporter periplasmic adaptor subunit [Bacteroidia bacterium]
MNKKIIYIAIGVAILAVLLIPKLKSNTSKSNKPSKLANAAIKVKIVNVAPEFLDKSIETTGNLLAEEEVVLYPETQGRVTEINFNEGAKVQKDMLLVKINDSDLQAQLKKAIATKQLKDDNEKRNKALLQKGAISQETYDIANNELISIQADIELLKEQIRKTKIIAPFSGIIGLRNVSVGSYITPSTKIAALQSIDKVKLEFSVPEKYAPYIMIGNKVSFTTDGSDIKYEAKVYGIEPKIDEVTRNVIMRAVCNNPNHTLLPGAFAKVTMHTTSNNNVFMLPTQALVPILKGQKIYIVQGDSVIERKVKTGIRKEDKIEITEGLNGNEQVVVEGVMYLRSGSKVRM